MIMVLDDAHDDAPFRMAGGVALDDAIGYRTASVCCIAIPLAPCATLVLQLINRLADDAVDHSSGGGDASGAAAANSRRSSERLSRSSRTSGDETMATMEVVCTARVTLPRGGHRCDLLGFLHPRLSLRFSV